jgi:hypothetical protein
VGLTQELLYLLLLYAVLSNELSLSTALMIAIAIILIGPCLQKLCCSGTTTTTTTNTVTGFTTLNGLV